VYIISVTDSGSGIPKDIAAKIMEPFFTTKTLGQGTGLGLSLCNNIFQMHQGTFNYNSSHSNTQFVITLPISKVLEMKNQYSLDKAS
jgi:signal transduction histidine kinase